VAVSAGPITGSMADGFSAELSTGEATATDWAPVGLVRIVHARHPTMATTASKINNALEFLRKPLRCGTLSLDSVVNSSRAIPPGKGSPGDGATWKVMDMPSQKSKRPPGRTAQQEAARALHRTASCDDCRWCGSVAFQIIDDVPFGFTPTRQIYGGPGAPGLDPPVEGMAMPQGGR
jgi:hypothetical protein